MGTGKGTKKQTKKTMEQYCSACKQSFEMEVVEGDDGAEVLWLKCPGCAGFLPIMTGEEDFGLDDAEQDDHEAGEAVDLAPEDIDKDRAREYSESD
ncbi:MAG: hypothetical protein PHQ19_07525, partial [Candidatus Krumholzibacteria bacterium]|nr:hypothetical protein [Candidatus Krumholzibacteria bacterium]